jgi:tetratricopeptide (TPR) repeat protein
VRIAGNLLRCLLGVKAAALVVSMVGLAMPPGPRAQQADRPESPGAVIAAQSALAHGNPEKAIQTLSNYLKTHANDFPARVLFGEALLMGGQSELAEAAFQAVLQSDPDNYAASMALGDMYDRTGQPEKAEPILARAVKLSHGAPEARAQWAVVLTRLRHYREADRALAGLPEPHMRDERIAFHRLKGSIAVGLGNARTAAAEMEKALALKPGDTQLKTATAVAEVQAQSWERAATLAAAAYSETRDPKAGLVLLNAQLGTNADISRTLESLRGTTLPPTEAAAFRQQLAEDLAAHGRFAESIEDFKSAAELDPSQNDLIFNLALAQFKSGRLDEALASAERSKEMGDSSAVEDLCGDIQEARGDNLAAVQSYQAAVALAPNEEKYRLSLAVELIRHQSFEPAKVVLKQAEETSPNSWRIQLALGMVEFFAGSDTAASRILVHAAELAPEPAAPLQYLGDIQIDRAAAPDPAAVDSLCKYSEGHAKNGRIEFYCGALMLRRDFTSGDKSHIAEILRRLDAAARLLPQDASPHCELGRAHKWRDQWEEARRESEICVRLDPNSAEEHYRLAQIYQRMGQEELAQQEIKLHDIATQRQAVENARRDETMKTFLYTIQQGPTKEK